MLNYKILFFSFLILTLPTNIVFAKNSVFNFEIDFDEKIFLASFNPVKEGKIDIKARLISAKEYTILANFKNVNLGKRELKLDLKSKGEIIIDDDGIRGLIGKVYNIMSFVNRKPIDDFVVNYSIYNRRLTINAFSWGAV